MRRKTRSKGGFRTKKEALAYLPKLAQLPAAQKNTAPTFRGLYDKWEPTHRAGPSTINCYRAAIKHFRPLWGARLDDIDIDDLQECMDECVAGKRTRENMKALCGLLYKYAVPRRMADINLGQYLIVSGQTCARIGHRSHVAVAGCRGSDIFGSIEFVCVGLDSVYMF